MHQLIQLLLQQQSINKTAALDATSTISCFYVNEIKNAVVVTNKVR